MITTPAVLDTCHRCGTPTLVGHSEGLLARAGAQPLDPHGELDALMDGRWTFDVHLEGVPRRAYLIYRCSFRIRAPRKWNVVATHKCPPGPHFPIRPGPPIEIVIPRGKPIPDTPPF
jgi:hypothetical protein